jgi:hypothetical protein
LPHAQLLLFSEAGLRHSRAMNKLLRTVRAVLWSFIGLGGRRSEADKRTEQVGFLPLILVAFVIVLLLVVGLVALARYAAGL